MGSAQNNRGRSSPFNFDGLIGSKPEIKQAADDAEIAASVGELVRRLRTTKTVTQSVLMSRTGITQAHISELERGLGPNGPTVATLARIVSELGDKVLFDTVSQRATRNTDQINDAQSWVLELLNKAIRKPEVSIAQSLTDAALTDITESEEAAANPFKRVFAQAILFGIWLAERHPFQAMQLRIWLEERHSFHREEMRFFSDKAPSLHPLIQMILEWEKMGRALDEGKEE